MQYASLSGFFHVFMPLEKSQLRFAVTSVPSSRWLSPCCRHSVLINLLSAFIERNDTKRIPSDLAWSFGCLILAAIFAAVFFLTKRIAVKLSSGDDSMVSCSRQA